MIIHIASKGETLTQLSTKYEVDIKNLAADNGLSVDSKLVVGQALAIQLPEIIHTIKRGETLTSIAKQYNTTALQLLRNNFRLNGLSNLTTGDELIIKYKNERRSKTFAINSYAYPYIDIGLLRSQLPYLTYLTPFTYGISSNGSLVLLNDNKLISSAIDYSVSSLLHLSTLTEGGGFSSERANLVFNNEVIQNSIINQILGVVEEKGYRGVDVDFEFIDPVERNEYISFLKKLKERLNAIGMPLFSALAPKTSDNQRGILYEGHDYSGIGEAVNFVLVMTYEWGYTYGPPLAVAPINNVRDVLEYALTRIPASKIFMGVPTYGYDWTLPYVKGGAGAPSLSPIEAVQLAQKYNAEIMYDKVSQAPWFRYTDNDGRTHEVWFEDVRSISAKLLLAEELGLFGIGYWNSMRDFPQNWVTLNADYNILNLSLI